MQVEKAIIFTRQALRKMRYSTIFYSLTPLAHLQRNANLL
jgi:hypothetical protein